MIIYKYLYIYIYIKSPESFLNRNRIDYCVGNIYEFLDLCEIKKLIENNTHKTINNTRNSVI